MKKRTRARFTPPDPLLTHKRWILVAHRAGARILRSQHGEGMSLIKDIPNPEGTKLDRAFDTDRPGRSFSSTQNMRHALSPNQPPSEHVADRFAKRLARLLEEGREMGRYAELVLVSQPRFLGRLRSFLSPATAKMVGSYIEKDFARVTDQDLAPRLKKITGI